jgi:hypothetical protein
VTALRYFKPGPAAVVGAILLGCAILVVYLVALAHARIEARTWRQRYCEVQVIAYNARNPRVQTLALVDPCVAWEEISGEEIR